MKKQLCVASTMLVLSISQAWAGELMVTLNIAKNQALVRKLVP